MPGVLREKNMVHSFVIWAIILIWFMIFVNRLMPGFRISLEQFITAQSFWLLSEQPDESDKITIVAIDEESRKRLNLMWPWKRGLTAALINNINSHDPKVIGLDIIFSGESEEDDDSKLAEAIALHPRVIIGSILNPEYGDKPLERFIDASASTGFVNKPLKSGVLDRTRTHYINSNGEAEFSLDIEILRNYLGIERSSVNVTGKGIAMGDKLFIPSMNGIAALNYLIYPSRFRTVPAHMVIENKVDPSFFRDKMVIVGATDPIIHDEFLTPLGVFPGVTIIGNTLSMFLSERFVNTVPVWIGCLLTAAIGFIFLLIGGSKIRLLYSLILAAGTMFITYAAFIYFRSIDIQLPYTAIIFSGSSAFIIPNFYRYTNLLYLSARLKNLALRDQLTDFDTPRFFIMKLDERLKSDEAFCLAALRIRNYNRLTIDMSFDEIKLLTKLLSISLRSEMVSRFRQVEFTRLSNDIFGLAVYESDKDKLRDFFSYFIKKINESGLAMGGRQERVFLQACLIHRDDKVSATGSGIIRQMEVMFSGMKTEDISIEGVSASIGSQIKNSSMDILDFIAYDWEEKNKELETNIREILEANKKLDRLNWGALRALARTVDAKSSWTAGHSERVTTLALKTGAALGMSQEDLDNLHRAGLLHDIGKIGVAQEILDKSGRLTKEEYMVMCEHPAKGASILEPIEDYAPIIPLIRQHHEWFNGEGYPYGLKGEEITVGGRILAVVDVFDALISDRPYRAGITLEKVVNIINEGVNTQFDPKVVDAFLGVIEQPTELPIQAVTK